MVCSIPERKDAQWFCQYSCDSGRVSCAYVVYPLPYCAFVVNSHRHADAVAMNKVDGLEYFVKPLEIEETFETFLDFICAQERGKHPRSRVKYAQTRTFTNRHLLTRSE